MRTRLILLLGALLAYSPAAAAAEAEAILGVEGALLTRDLAGDPELGGLVGLRGALGLSDSLWLAADVQLSHLRAAPDRDRDRPPTVGGATVGLEYGIDALAFVPSVSVGVGLATARRQLSPTIRAAVAVDRFITRSLSLGLVLGGGWLPPPLGGARYRAGLRLSWRLELLEKTHIHPPT